MVVCQRCSFAACIFAGMFLCAASVVDQAKVEELSSHLDGEAVLVQQTGFDFPGTLTNYLRRGDTIFAAPEPAWVFGSFRHHSVLNGCRVFLTASSEDDVVKGVQLALSEGLKVAFHGSGHHQAGISLQPGGITIGLENLKSFELDEETSIATFQVGFAGIELANVTSQYGLHFRVGHAGSTAVSGYSLAGGLGWGGLAVDRILALYTVNTWEYPNKPLGIVRVDADNYPDLFWALRGAGQNMAAVVRLEAQLSPLRDDLKVRSVQAGWRPDRAESATQTFMTYLEDSDFDGPVDRGLMFLTLPGFGRVLAASLIDWSTDNSSDEFLDGWKTAARAAGGIVIDRKDPYLHFLEMWSAPQEYPNVSHYALSAIVPPSDIATVSALMGPVFMNATSNMSIVLLGYEPGRDGIRNNETAFGWRDNWYVAPWAFWTRTAGGAEEDGDVEHIEWVRDAASLLEPYSKGHYSGFTDFEREDDTQRSYPSENWDRIVAAKATYDPYNLFRSLDFYHNDGGYGPLNAAPDDVTAVGG